MKKKKKDNDKIKKKSVQTSSACDWNRSTEEYSIFILHIRQMVITFSRNYGAEYLSICFIHFKTYPQTWVYISHWFNCLVGTRNEPRYEKTGLRGFRPGPTQTGLYSHRRWLEH